MLDISLIHRTFLTALSAAFLLVPALPVQAETADYTQAEGFIEKMAQRTLDFVADDTMSIEEKKAAFRDMLDRHFDLDTIGRFSLGRYWRMTTPKEKKRYQHLFREMVVEVYSDRFEDYRDQDFEVRSSRAEGDNDVLVTSYIIPENEPEVRVDWRVRKKGSKYRIIDVIVEDVSMLMTKRSDFSSIIQRGGGNVEVLLEHLEKYDK